MQLDGIWKRWLDRENNRSPASEEIVAGRSGASGINQKIRGTRDDDRLEGGIGDDKIRAGRGDDEIVDSAGSDRVNGGKGFDTAVFFGDRSDYDIVMKGKKILVTRDGVTDTLTNIEELTFGNDPDSASLASFHVKGRRLVEQDPQPDQDDDDGTGNPTADDDQSTVDDQPTPPSPLGLDEFEAEVLRLTNAFRVANGREPLRTDDRLNDAADDWSTEMALGDFFRHSSVGRELDERNYDWVSWGENIAAGYSTPESVVNGWINSPGHRANMLSDNFQEIGIGYFHLENDNGRVNYNHYWTQVFGTEAGDAFF